MGEVVDPFKGILELGIDNFKYWRGQNLACIREIGSIFGPVKIRLF